MARTYTPWSETVPDGSNAANTADDHIRRLRVEIRELLNQLMGVTEVTALSDPVISYPATNYQLIPGSAAVFYPSTYALPTLTVGAFIEWNQSIHGGQGAVVFPLDAIPIGAKITKFEIFVSSSSNTSAITSLVLLSTALVSGAAVIANTNFDTPVPAFTSGIADIKVGSHTPAGGIVLDGTTTYSVEISFNGPAAAFVRVHGLKVSYTRPSLAVIR